MHGGDAAEGVALTPDDFYENRWDPSPNTVPSISNRLEALQADISNGELATQGLNLIGRKDVINGKPVRFPFCNLCLQCLAPQNNFHLSRRITEQMGQAEPPKHKWAFGDSYTREQEEDVPSPFGIAVIPRKVEGSGIWALHEPPAEATS